MSIDFKSPQFQPTPNFIRGKKTNLIGLSYPLLEKEIIKIGEKPFKAKQIWNWIYAKGIKEFSQMLNISKETREKLQENYSIQRPIISQDLTSTDGTRKWLIKFSDCREAEMVFIPEDTRGTLCISSQVGCTLTCKFCHTGTQLLVRNLSAGEIVAQLMLARDLLRDWETIAQDGTRKVTSMVFMGMGEPFFNYENVKQAVEILNSPNGINFSKRKITISTSGVVPEIIRFSDEVQTVLAISLHSPNDEVRSKIMPLNKKYPLKELMKACQYYTKTNPSGRITFEYVMLKDINDSDDDARSLVRMLKENQLPSLINLIPFNPWQDKNDQELLLECSSRNRIMSFGKILKNAGFTTTIRKTRGQDVMAACGQLKSTSQRVVKA
jgi:23S rRNA (adenine2503-C2)-methyltransferase